MPKDKHILTNEKLDYYIVHGNRTESEFRLLVASNRNALAEIDRYEKQVADLKDKLLASKAAHRNAWGLYETERSAREILEQEMQQFGDWEEESGA